MALFRKAALPVLLALAGSLPAAPAPTILFSDVPSGPTTGGPGNLGVPISIFGKNFGTARGASKVTIGGVEVASYLAWGEKNANNPWLDMITVQPGPRVTGGPVVVTVEGVASTADIQFQKSTGRVLYLSPSGSDGSGCSESSPCKTVLAALGNKMQPGDTVLVRGGTYSEDEMWIRDNLKMSGTAARRKTVKAYPGEAPVFANGARGVAIAAHYLTFAGLHFRNGKSIGITDDYNDKAAIGRGVWLINNTVIGPIAYEGLASHGSDHIIAGNLVRVESSTQGTQGHCLYASHGDNVKILYNALHGAPGYGIHLFDQVRQKKDYRRTITNFLIEGNVTTGSPQRSGLLMVMDDGGDWGTYGNYMDNVVVRNNIFAKNNHHGIVLGQFVRNIKIYNNTFYENGRQGIFVGEHPAMTGIEIRNNLIYQSANNGVCKVYCEWYQPAHIQDVAGNAARVIINQNGYFPGGRNVVTGKDSRISALATDGRAVTGQAGLRNAAQSDFTLVAGSAAIDRGAVLPLVTRDFNGGLRPAGAAPDLGAYELGSGGGAPGLLPPVMIAPMQRSAVAPAAAASTVVAAAKPAKNVPPVGALNEISNTGVASGWASDPNDPGAAVKLYFYVDKNADEGGARPLEALANFARAEGEGRAFDFVIPDQYRDNKPHRIWGWAVDQANPAERVMLTGGPRSFKLSSSGPKPKPFCGNGPITKECMCGGQARSDNFCCDGQWFSYDACKKQ